MKIKVCGITTIQDAAFLHQQDVDYAGFIFYPKSPRYVGKEPDPELFSATGHDVKNVGVFVNSPTGEVIDMANDFQLDLVQLHGEETPAYCQEIKSAGIEIIKAFRVDDNFDPSVSAAFSPCSDYFLFDTKSSNYGGAGKKFNWQILNDITSLKPFFLSGGIGPDDAEEIMNLQLPALHAIDINSKFETKPGSKDHQKLQLFLDKIKHI
ncbi:MAG TPA: phosphoribosylanthranilate isomerase [Bacteroidales bacterium]|nr:phosphoribosylanthranilate isomerase [Bacteroidales bacterium]